MSAGVVTSAVAALPVADSWQLDLFETMLRIRAFELRINELFSRGAIRGTAHLCVGQEAIPTGVCAALNSDDLVSATHRGHGAAIAKGLDCYRLFAEILGRRDGYCLGRGGSQHIACLDLGFLGTNGITGGGLPIATGAALAIQRLAQKRVVAAFFGDGAVNQGTFHESLNLAAIWRLPIVFVCENNLYAMSAPADRFIAGGGVARRADAYDIPHTTIDGNNLEQVRTHARSIVHDVRNGAGPFLLECQTYRHLGHSKSDRCEYRSRDEERGWKARDPIDHWHGVLTDRGIATPSELDALSARVDRQLDQAAARAQSCPPVDPETLFDHVTPSPATWNARPARDATPCPA